MIIIYIKLNFCESQVVPLYPLTSLIEKFFGGLVLSLQPRGPTVGVYRNLTGRLRPRVRTRAQTPRFRRDYTRTDSRHIKYAYLQGRVYRGWFVCSAHAFDAA